MAKSIPSLAEPAMLRWGRKTAGMSLEDVAAAMKRTVEETKDWESGRADLSFAQLRQLAKIYKRPVAVFYLPEPPPDFTVIRDFRRLPTGQVSDYSPALRFAIRSMQSRQEWLSEFLSFQASEPLGFIGSASLKNEPAEVGKRLRSLLGVTMQQQSAQSDKETAFRFWRDRCEQVGAFVLQTRNVPLSEMRGFALPDPYAPIVTVNAKDAYAGRTFTLLHEMVHIMLNMPGVSDRNVPATPRGPDQHAEAFCNAAAAESLVPAVDFLARVGGYGDCDSAIGPLATTYRVSEEVIARRMLDHGLITRAEYETKRHEFAERAVPQKVTKRDIRIPRARLVISTVGKRFARTAFNAFQGNEIGGSELSDLLDMKLNHLPRFESELFPSSINAFQNSE